MAMGLPGLHCCRLPAHGSLTPLCAALARRPLPRTSALRYSSLEAQARDTIGEEVLRMFLKERQLHDDFVTKISDMVWRRNGGNVDAVEATTDQGSAIEVAQPEDNWQNESDKRKELNLLKYEALKDELLLLTTGIGAACSLYCLLVFSLEVLPRMMGFLAYKVAALVQVYRDNEDLRLILHEEEDADREST
ncbi:hypothetical protein Zm00014a_043153 [Zea mays]|uniref:Uncharacterized protein n=1 Tax=Zea mays TaxID=4577 RepID=A0A3L6EFN3_MAIZE|nr:hypothetical protein Zm00014a_043153 [Zea mays]